MAACEEESNCEKWEKFIEPVKAAVRRSGRLKEINGDEEFTPPRVIQNHAQKKGLIDRSLQKIGDIECLSKIVSLGIAHDSRRASEDRRKGTDSSGATGQIDIMTKELSQLKGKGKSPVSANPSGASVSADASQYSGVSFSLCRSTFDLVTKYIQFDTVHFLDLDGAEGDRLPRKIERELPDITDEIRRTMKEKNSTLGLKSIGDQVHNESDARVLIDCVVMYLSKWLLVTTKTEFSLYYNNLPGGKLDYFFIDREGKPLGCLEAKQPSQFKENAFTQTVMELLLVQQEAIRMGLPVHTTPLFGILSDGKRYILIMLEGHYLKVEKNRKTGKLKVRNVEKSNDFKDLIAAIVQMILLCQNSRIKKADVPGIRKADDKKTSGKKAEGTKADDKKTGGKKADEKKAAGKKGEGTKADEKKAAGKKAEGTKADEKKAAGKKAEGTKADDKKTSGK